MNNEGTLSRQNNLLAPSIRALFTGFSYQVLHFFWLFQVGIIRLIFGMTPLPRSAYLLGVEGGDAGQHLALEELERGAAARGAEGHLWLGLG